MCLSVVYRGKKKKEALAKLPERGRYWKVTTEFDDGYYPEFYNTSTPFKAGVNKFKRAPALCGTVLSGTVKRNYWAAGHFFRGYEAALRWASSYQKAVSCKIEKKDIVAIGEQGGFGLTIVATKAIFPKYVGK